MIGVLLAGLAIVATDIPLQIVSSAHAQGGGGGPDREERVKEGRGEEKATARGSGTASATRSTAVSACQERAIGCSIPTAS